MFQDVDESITAKPYESTLVRHLALCHLAQEVFGKWVSEKPENGQHRDKRHLAQDFFGQSFLALSVGPV